MMQEQKLIDWAAGQVAIGGMIGSLIEQTMASYNAGDQWADLEPRLANAIRESDDKPVKYEVVPQFWDELSGDHYCNRALFYKDGHVEIVSYKGEGEGEFETESEYRQYVIDMQQPREFDCDDYEDEE